MSIISQACVLATGFASLGLLLAEWRKSQLGSWLTKPVAALGFVVLGVSRASAGSRYDVLLVVGLLLCMGGDVLLIPKRRSIFAAGILSFLLGHVAFLAAFVSRGVSGQAAMASGVGLTLVGAVVLRWLLPHSGNLRLAVIAYVVVITSMVAVAVGTAWLGGGERILLGALMFYLSDLAVARERFVKSSFVNRLWGTPLYFAAMLVIASTVGGSAGWWRWDQVFF